MTASIADKSTVASVPSHIIPWKMAGKKDAMLTARPGQEHRQQAEVTLYIRREWPQLARELFELEQEILAAHPPASEQAKRAQLERVRSSILDDCRHYERQYEAYELVRRGRACEIVGNPHYKGNGQTALPLPYTGLEGYYAGSEALPARPGLTQEQIIQEEATIGLELMRNIKRHCIASYSWSSFTRLRRADEEEATSLDCLKDLYLLWTVVVRRLSQRVYKNEEYQVSPLERLEGLIRKDSRLARNSSVQAQYTRLVDEERQLSREQRQEEHAKELARTAVMKNRLQEFTKFREATYAFLRGPAGLFPHIDYCIEDRELASASIVETLCLPKPGDRNASPPYVVNLTPEQVEGYLFLAHLGEKGGDPLTRSMLLARGDIAVHLL